MDAEKQLQITSNLTMSAPAFPSNMSYFLLEYPFNTLLRRGLALAVFGQNLLAPK